jgi:hypothetical protein
MHTTDDIQIMAAIKAEGRAVHTGLARTSSAQTAADSDCEYEGVLEGGFEILHVTNT